jgi:hypothetical protein
MLPHGTLLVSRLGLGEQIPTPVWAARDVVRYALRQGAPRHEPSARPSLAYAVRRFLEHAAPVAQHMRRLRMARGRVPTRRTRECRVERLPPACPYWSVALDALCLPGSGPGRPRDTRQRVAVCSCAPTAASRIRNIGWPGQSRIPRWLLKPCAVRPGRRAGYGWTRQGAVAGSVWIPLAAEGPRTRAADTPSPHRDGRNGGCQSIFAWHLLTPVNQ